MGIATGSDLDPSSAGVVGVPSRRRLFLSYSHENARFARRFCHDLRNAGFDCWIDQDIPSCSSDWVQHISSVINEREELVFLVSPESQKSEHVKTEVELAQRASLDVRRLRLTDIRYVDPVVQKAQLQDWSCASTTYRDSLRAFLREHGSDEVMPADPLSDFDLPGLQVQAHPAGSMLEGPKLQRAGFVASWLDVTPYTCSWLVAPAAWDGEAPDSLVVLFRFTGGADRNTLQEVLNHRLKLESQPWILLIEGHLPSQQANFCIPNDSPHIWEDCLNSCARLLNHSAIKSRKITLYLDCPNILAMAVGQRIDRGRAFDFYQFNRSDSSYQRVCLPG